MHCKEAKYAQEGQGMVRGHKRVLVSAPAGTRMCAAGNKVTHDVFHGTVPDRAVLCSVFSEAAKAQCGVLRMPVAFIFPLWPEKLLFTASLCLHLSQLVSMARCYNVRQASSGDVTELNLNPNIISKFLSEPGQASMLSCQTLKSGEHPLHLRHMVTHSTWRHLLSKLTRQTAILVVNVRGANLWLERDTF